ncbi:MAG: hypothetical protein AAFQ66_16350 [Pseudomonadota bacterium]
MNNFVGPEQKRLLQKEILFEQSLFADVAAAYVIIQMVRKPTALADWGGPDAVQVM